MPACPICNEYVVVGANQNPDQVMNAHIASGCTAHLLKVTRATQREALASATRCDQPTGCRNHEKYATIRCSRCGGQFCIKHRMPETHQCASLALASTASAAAAASSSTATAAPADKHARGNALLAKLKANREARQAAQASRDHSHAQRYPTKSTSATAASSSSKPYQTLQQIRQSINAAGQAAAAAISNVVSSVSPTPSVPHSSSPTSSNGTGPSCSPSPSPVAPATQPLKLTPGMRMQAIGDKSLPESQRLYLSVDARAIRSKKQPKLFFFPLTTNGHGSKKSPTMGKVLDLICEEYEIENENHLQGGKRLYICCPRLNATFPPDLPLSSLEGVLQQGDTVTLSRTPLQA